MNITAGSAPAPPRPSKRPEEKSACTRSTKGGSSAEAVEVEEWLLEDRRHRVGAPAVTEYDAEGRVRREAYYVNGKLHRVGGPADVYYDEGGTAYEELYYRKGGWHRTNGPAVVRISPDGGRVESYYENDESHRVDGPSRVETGPDGYSEEWQFRGERHRVGGPAVTFVKKDGSREELWQRHGDLHRIDGPAVIKYDPTGRVVSRKWQFGGQSFPDTAAIGQRLAQWNTEALRGLLIDELTSSPYAVLLDEGLELDRLTAVLAEGVTTVEGIREVLAGSPTEWVRAWEVSQ